MIVKNLLKLALLGSSWVMYMLLALSVLSIAAMVERWWFFRKSDEDVDALGDKLCDLLERGEHEAADRLLAASPSIEASILKRAIRWVHGGPEALANAIDSEMARKRRDLERGMNLLGTLGNNAPFIGLFGTVIGVIEAFNHLGAGQDKAAMGNVMSGIAEALVATGVGLFVAIPAVIAFNVFQKKVSTVEDNVSIIAKQIGALLEAVRHVGRGWHDPEGGETPGDVGGGVDGAPRERAVDGPRRGELTMGSAVGNARGKRGGIIGINVTPMVDVVLVLLVIMMVSATYIVSQALKVELPKSASTDEAVAQVSAVTLTKDGRYSYNQEPMRDDEQLVDRFKLAKAQSADVSLVISADAEALHGRVVHIIDLAKQHGITKFAINVQSE